MENKALALAVELRTLCQNDLAGPYTMLQPRATSDGVTLKVKDKRSAKTLTVVVTEDE
jgi:hypothetical protein